MPIRRRLALVSLVAVAIGLAPWRLPDSGAAAPITSVRSGAWSDPATWGGRQAGGGPVTIGPGTQVRLDQPATRVAGLTIAPGATLVYDPRRSATLESTANVIVQGRLEMRPASPAVLQTLRFVGVDERAFKGGGMDPIASDVGLWVTGHGQLALVGSRKLAWTRAEGMPAGAAKLSLDTNPVGWRPGDELAIAPTQAPNVGDASWDGFDETAVRAVSGRSVSITRATERAHPEVAGLWRPEVLNLTRNVRIEGTPRGRTHVMITANRPQTVAYVQIRYVGPRQAAEEFTSLVRGRYGLHFHMMGDGSRGSRVTGTVVRDAGSYAFVPHRSHGISFRDTISYNTMDGAYWWDNAPDNRTAGDETHDTLYDRAVAAKVRTDPDFRGYRLAGFSLLQGLRNEVRNSVAVGVQGNEDASGFSWPESSGANGHGVWKFETGNVAHNNKVDGIFAWQNDGQPHRISGFTAYHNGAFGIDHGAYQNGYQYDHSTLYGNGAGAIRSRASSWFEETKGEWVRLRFDNLLLDGASISPYLIVADDHVGQTIESPTLITNTVMRGFTKAAVAMRPEEHNEPYAFDMVRDRIPERAFSLAAGIPTVDHIRVQNGDTAYQVTTMDSGRGRPVPAWNARRSSIGPFYDLPLAAFAPGAPPPRSPSLAGAPAARTAQPATPTTAAAHSHAAGPEAQPGHQPPSGAGARSGVAAAILAGVGLLGLGLGTAAYRRRRGRGRPTSAS
jgi:hypothetical protein